MQLTSNLPHNVLYSSSKINHTHMCAVLMNIKNASKTGPAMAWLAGPSATALKHTILLVYILVSNGNTSLT